MSMRHHKFSMAIMALLMVLLMSSTTTAAELTGYIGKLG